MEEIPAYLFWGFLESGKTSLIMDTLSQDYFQDGERTMILSFEDGEVSYSEEFLQKANAFLVQMEDIKDCTNEGMMQWQEKEHPDRIMIEYNGMFEIEGIMDVIDETNLDLYQVVVTVDATTAQMYLANMRSLMANMFKMANLVIFNRCDDQTNVGTLRRSIKALNPRTQVGFERADGREMSMDEILPFGVDDEVIQVAKEDFGIWYIDAMERPEVYKGKCIELIGQVRRTPTMKGGIILIGRRAMTCCEDDITFIGYTCRLNHTKSKTLKRIVNGQTVKVRAKIALEEHPDRQGSVPVLHALQIEKEEDLKNELIYF